MDDASWDYRGLIETHAGADRSTRARVRRAFQRSVGRSPRDYSTGSGTIRM